MKKNANIPKPHTKELNKNDSNNFPDYQIYASSEDIYNKDQEESDIDPENISKMKDIIH